MSVDETQALAALRSWAGVALAAGWLTDNEVRGLERIESQSAERLFAAGRQRPLVVGLFGGTGVGKSSLLNRLAGEEIARVGVERPTSHEVTLYLHQDHALGALPDEFPTDKTRVAFHRDDARREVVWIDMPDMDSTERANRELAFAWLPYIDWLVYVVSPERYRDDVGWQVLKERGHRHAWLFVMNQWDLAGPQQLRDFAADLERSGFDEPVVLRTACVDRPVEDDFARLEETINEALRRHGLAELQRLGGLARLRDMDRLAEALAGRFGGTAVWGSFLGEHRAAARNELQQLDASLQWPIELITAGFRERERGVLRRLTRSGEPEAHQAPMPRDITLWSGQAQRYVDDIAAQAVVLAGKAGIAAGAVERGVQERLAESEREITDRAQDRLREAVARPGTAWSRFSMHVTGALRVVLPLAAASWVGYEAVTAFRAASRGDQPFLGIDFAAHALLLVGVAWLIPFLLHRYTRPSLAASVRRGLRRGIAQGVAIVLAGVEQAHRDLSRQREELLDGLRQWRRRHLAPLEHAGSLRSFQSRTTNPEPPSL